MSQLLNLPDEVLSRIVKRLSDVEHEALFSVIHVNKRLNNIATPLLVRCWPPRGQNVYPNGAYSRFAQHLLHQPHLRRNIRFLDLDEISTRMDADSVELVLDPEELEQLASTGLQDWPALSDLTGWKEQIDEGIDDAFVVLFLLWARNLVELIFTVPHVGSPSEDEGQLLTLGFVSQVAREFINRSENGVGDQLPLTKLQSVSFRHWDTENGVNGKYSAPFFHLPNLRTFKGWMVEMDGSSDDEEEEGTYLTEFPAGTSSVEEIILEYSDVSLSGISSLVRACRRLTTLALDFGPVLENDEFDSSGLAELLVTRADSLQNFGINWGESPTLEITADGPLKIEECFRQLHNLEYLEIPVSMLCEEEDIDGQVGFAVKPGRLPKSIRCLCLVGDIRWRFKDAAVVNRLIESLDELLLKCGPEGELPHLEALELIRLLDTPDDYDYKPRLKATGLKKDVQVIFNKFQWRPWGN